jgi:hypothetical protein
MTSTSGEGSVVGTGGSDLVRILLEDRWKRDDELAEERARRQEETRQQAIQIQEQLAMIRSLVETSRSTAVPGGETRPVEGHRHKLVLTKFGDGEDIEAFLTTFERLMTVYGMEQSRCAIKLAPQLTGKAQQAYAAMNADAAADYVQVKSAILRRYDICDETYRQRFRSTRVKLTRS